MRRIAHSREECGETLGRWPGGAGCVVIIERGEAADERRERFGVWASVDRSVKPGRKATAA
jgi:hypothetical protein